MSIRAEHRRDPKGEEMSEKATTQNAALKYDLHDKPPVPQWIVLAIQHVFAMLGATILVPILVNAQAGEEVLTIPVTLVCAGDVDHRGKNVVHVTDEGVGLTQHHGRLGKHSHLRNFYGEKTAQM